MSQWIVLEALGASPIFQDQFASLEHFLLESAPSVGDLTDVYAIAHCVPYVDSEAS